MGAATGTTVDQAVQAPPPGTDRAWTVGLVGGVLLLVILFVAYLAGGYVAGRMARFNGARQGLAVWLWGVAITGLLAAVAAVAGPQYDIPAQVNLPRIRTNELNSALQTTIAIAGAAAVALTGAVLGGLAGMRFHRRVDRADTTQASDVDTLPVWMTPATAATEPEANAVRHRSSNLTATGQTCYRNCGWPRPVFSSSPASYSPCRSNPDSPSSAMPSNPSTWSPWPRRSSPPRS